MSNQSAYFELAEARRETATQLAALVAALGRMEPGGAAQAYRASNSTAGEVLTLLRQVVRLLTVIESTRAASRIAGGSGSGGGAQSGGDSGGINGFLGNLLSVVSKGLGIASAIAGIVGLFRKRREPASSPTPYASPQSLSLEIANTDHILRGFPRFDYSASGDRRLIDTPASVSPAIPEAATASEPVSSSPMQITVNVSAMDSKSFRDHAPELAEAVRDAMLNLHPINQVIRDWM